MREPSLEELPYREKGEMVGEMRPRLPTTYKEFPPEVENLELWEVEGKIQNEKYSGIGQK